MDAAGTTAYDAASRRTSITYPSGSNQATYPYDRVNRLSSVTDWNSQATRNAYDDAKRMTTTTLPSGTGVVSSYNGNLTGRGSDTFAWDYEARNGTRLIGYVRAAFAWMDGISSLTSTIKES